MDEGMDDKRTKQPLPTDSKQIADANSVQHKEEVKEGENELSYDSNSVIDFHQGIWYLERDLIARSDSHREGKRKEASSPTVPHLPPWNVSPDFRGREDHGGEESAHRYLLQPVYV